MKETTFWPLNWIFKPGKFRETSIFEVVNNMGQEGGCIDIRVKVLLFLK